MTTDIIQQKFPTSQGKKRQKKQAAFYQKMTIGNNPLKRGLQKSRLPHFRRQSADLMNQALPTKKQPVLLFY
jgi:hypothetical protein